MPTDGWASSVVTLAEDRLPLTAPDLDAWLWRIDQAARLIDQRAGALDRMLPTDAAARYVEATRLLTDNLRKVHARADDADVIYVNSYGDVRTPDQVVDDVVSVEDDVLRNAA